MKRSLNKGFTLVELLVVMAIISLLAAIVVPNVINYIRQGRATRARADISGLESALVKILSDSGRGNLGQLFNPNAVGAAIGVSGGQTLTADSFKAAQEIYTQAMYVILRQGRSALGESVNGIPLINLLNAGVIYKLSSSYVELGFDPWGKLYNIYPGPWPTGNGAIPFRKFLAEAAATENDKLPGSGSRPDVLTLELPDPDTGLPISVGYPAPRDKVAFIWSNGENLASGTAIYNPNGYAPTGDGLVDVANFYDTVNNAEDALLAVGGDDVNNWDNGSSWSRYY